MAKNIKVTKESPSGRNQRFQIGQRGVSRGVLVREIQTGQHPEYHVRNVNGIPTPASNPDGKTRNNLG